MTTATKSKKKGITSTAMQNAITFGIACVMYGMGVTFESKPIEIEVDL